jgi:nitrile hydratase subunit beta
MDGFGAIERETDEPVFHEAWEGRVFGMALTAGRPEPIGATRHRLERLDPLKYLGSSYYERWLAGLESALIETGALAPDEIEARVQQLAANPELPMPRREDPERAEALAGMFRAGRPETLRTIRQKPRFAPGDKIVTRNLNPHGHTRLPRYARGKRGTIVAHRGAHVFPDTNAHALGENPQHLYTVRIAMRELWGNSAEPNGNVLIDLWESYLDADKAAAKSKALKGLPATNKAMAKTRVRSIKVSGRATSTKSASAKPLPSIIPRPRGAKGKSGSARATASHTPGSAGSGRRSGKPVRRNR